MVYIDNFNAPYGRMKMCHMVADTTAELLAMATRIGVAHKWLQDAGEYSEHFDICLSKKAKALEYGAKEITAREFARICGTRPNAPEFIKKLHQPTKRLFIENDPKISADKYGTIKLSVSLLKKVDDPEKVFDTLILDALVYDRPQLIQAIKDHDEIYCSTALLPLNGGSFGSGSLMCGLMRAAIAEGIKGKRLYILREYSAVRWFELDADLVAKCFAVNHLFVYGPDNATFDRVDIKRLLSDVYM